MADPNIPPQKVSNRISPLAIIIAVGLVVLVAFAFLKMEGHHVTPTGADAPMAQTPGNVVMPEQPHVANTPQPAANTNDSVEAQPTTDKEPGGMASHSGPANSAGAGTGAQ